MLDRMRRHRGWLKWSLALVVLAFIVFYIPDFLRQGDGAAPNDVVARVGGQDITAAAFRRAYLSQLQAYQRAYGGGVSSRSSSSSSTNGRPSLRRSDWGSP
jgi:hypothetical protein